MLQILSVLHKNTKVWNLQLTLALVYAEESGPSFACDKFTDLSSYEYIGLKCSCILCM